jgi:hypothetical protein
MKDNPDLLWVKQQIRRTLADYNGRVAPPLASVPEPARPAPEKHVQRRRCDARHGPREARRPGSAAQVFVPGSLP